jgi:hypothetical protein
VPPAFVAEIVNTCGPSTKPVADHETEHADAGPPSKLHVTAAAGSLTENHTVAPVAVVDTAGPAVTVTVGAGGIGAATVQLYDVDDVPPAFDAEIVKTCDPTASPIADHDTEHADAGPPSKLQLTAAAGSSTENHTVAAVAVDNAAGPDVTATDGGEGVGDDAGGGVGPGANVGSGSTPGAGCTGELGTDVKTGSVLGRT